MTQHDADQRPPEGGAAASGEAPAESAPVRSFSGTVRQPITLGGFEIAIALSGIFFVLSVPSRPPFQHLPLLVVAMLAFAFTAHKAASRGRSKHARFLVRGRDLLCEGELMARVPEGALGLLFEKDDRLHLDLVAERRVALTVAFDSAADATALEAALGLSRAPVRIGSDRSRAGRGALFALATSGLLLGLSLATTRLFFAHGLYAIAIAGLVLGSVSGMFVGLRTDISVGTDGIWVQGLGRARFVEFGEVVGVGEVGPWVRVATRSGDLYVAPPLSGLHQSFAGAKRALVDLLRARLAAWAEMETPTLSELAPHEGTFRARGTTTDDLVAVVESPRAPRSVRARAALALRRHEEWPRFESRVRIAAQSSASPALARALEAAVRDDAEAEAALRKLEREGRS
jgi:hypothetical protein